MNVNIVGPYFGKAAVCEPILRSLPDWFGIEQAIMDYLTEVDHLPTFLAYDTDAVVGFLSLKLHNPSSAEVYVMGTKPESHRKGIGRALINRAQTWLMSQSIEYLQVKTLGPSHSDENYAKTRDFYAAMGFKPLEEFKQIWDEHNPCLIMIKGL